MNFRNRTAFPLLGKGLVDRLDSFYSVLPVFKCLGVKDYEARSTLYRQNHRSPVPFEKPGKLGGLALERRQGMYVFSNVDHLSTSKASYQMLDEYV
jgi:hypothetical protein